MPRRRKVSTDNKGWVRWAANLTCLVGYYLLINDSFAIGLALKGVADVGIIIWGYYNKLWDVVAITVIFCVMNFQRLSEVYSVEEILYTLKTITGG